MTFDMPVPTAIAPGANRPAYSPIGESVVTSTVTLRDLARGIAIYANRYEGGQQTVRAIMDIHCSAAKDGIQFIAFTEEEAYGYLQYDHTGARIPGCIPIITLRKNDVLNDARIDLLVKAFKNKEISIEYVMGGKDNEVYSDEIHRLGLKLINAEVGDYVLVFDQSDSVMIRRRHGNSEPHIRTIADMLSRQYPPVGFIAYGTGPGNAIIESVRRAEMFIGKKMTTSDKIVGFLNVTGPDVVKFWEKDFGYQNVAIGHAWKHANSGKGNPELLDITTVSAILDGGRRNLTLTQHPTVTTLRQAMSKAKSKGKAKKGGKRGTSSSRAGMVYSAEALQRRRGGLCAPIDSMLKQDGYTYRKEVREIAGLMLRTAPGSKGRTISMDAYSTIKSTPSIQKAAAFANACQKKVGSVISVSSLGMLYVSIVKQDAEAAIAYLLGIAGRPGGSADGLAMRETLQGMTVGNTDIARYDAAHARWIELTTGAPSNVVEMRDMTMRKAA